MRILKATNATIFGLAAALVTVGTLVGCNLAGGLAALPFAHITAVQLFDQPNYTVAFTIEGAVNNPSLISKINWVFGDSGGFVEGATGRATISHQYAAVGVYKVSAYVFSGNQFVAQIDGVATVVDGGGAPNPVPGDLPGKITGPNPRDKATNVDVTTKLTWTADSKATSHDVYLGTDEADVENATLVDLAFQGTQTATSFDPGGLDPEKEYYWRIDERNDAGVTKGTVLTFTTAKAPKKAKNFVPVNGAGQVSVEQILQWTAGSNTSSHNVYFGKDQTEVANATKDTTDIFKGNQSGVTYDPSDDAAALEGQLLPSTTYYWRIDEVGLGGTIKGDVLSFTTADLPPAVTNPSPADGAVDVDVDSNLSWSALPAISSFDVYFGTNAVAVGNALHGNTEYKGNRTSKAYTPSALSGATTYYWRIDTLGTGGTAKGAVFSFTTAQPPPQVVGPFSPANNATNVSYTTTIQWNVGGGGGTSSFDVYFGTSESAVASGDSSVFKTNLDSGITEYDPNDLTPDTQYFWRIDAVGPGGATAGPVLRFRVGALPGPVGNVPTPANGARGVALDVTLGWTAGVGAVSHDVYFGTDQTAVQNATITDAAYKTRQAGTTYSPGPLQGNTTYYWRIDEVSPGGSTKGPVWNFKTVPGQATNPDPMHQDTGIALDVTMSWTVGAGAVSHDVYFGTVEAVVLNATTATVGIYKGNRADNSWQPPDLLAGMTTYYWRIDEVGAPVDGTTKGLVWQFTTGAGQAAVPIAPPNGATGVALNPILTWHAGAGAASHDIYFGNSQSTVQSATTASTEYQGNQLLGVESFSVIGPLAGNTNYYWRIDELDAANHVTKGSIWQFKTGAGLASNPTPAHLAEGIDVNADLSWTAGSGALSHNVYFGTNAADVGSDTPPPAVSKGNQTATTYDPGLLIGGTTYYWRIDEVGPGATVKGTVWQFKTGAGQAAVPINPANGASGVVLNPTLTWQAGGGAASHDVYFGTSQSNVSNATTASAEYQGNQPFGDESFSPIGPLAGNTNYYWRIDELDAANHVTKGSVWQFRTGTGQASAPTPEDGAAGIDINANLSWTAGSAATSHDVYLGTNEAAVTNATHGSPEFKGNQTATTYDPAEFTPGGTYYWRIDEVGPGGTAKGAVWQFETGAGQASNPSPADAHSGVALSTSLSWAPGALTESQDVYFGTTLVAVQNATRTSDEFKGNQIASTFSPGALSGMTFYYWRIDSVTADGTTKGKVWQFRTGPGKASGPSPASFATGVSVDAFITWTAGAGAASHDVYFSTSQVDVVNGAPAASKGNQAGTAFDPGTLAAGSTYYWRIDEVASGGTIKTTGDVWRFTVALPGKSSNPSPSNLAAGVALAPTLAWTAGEGAASHDVYFSTSQSDVLNGLPAALRGNQPGTAFDPGTLAAGSVYYWRIDEVSANGVTKTTGDVWRFTVVAPSKAANPSPANAATGVVPNPTLVWTAGAGAASHDVYFSTSQADVINGAPAAFKGNQAGTAFDPGPLNLNTTYYWRIDEVSANGVTKATGDTWSFKTTP